jgi:hypothetical protein
LICSILERVLLLAAAGADEFKAGAELSDPNLVDWSLAAAALAFALASARILLMSGFPLGAEPFV